MQALLHKMKLVFKV